ncbi:RNA polymerase sigma factor [Cohnella zeiphila]|uniref:Sigma-70 family RNA polymerase sigma factor n=1 Tax=Cohnella zeiphila TaxID=2761120 RepID=A0A7X0SIA2_9BACL|nr:sigma-70 family RNA polymerase sigma factor [Cohnella zeiphila]MBB6730472.1 sigma-70 family RNA polymerase sigma factor [Cohnella zeiphila]
MHAMARNHNEDMAKWLQEIGEGSTEAFDRFYERAVAWLMPLACRMLEDRMEAEDACHDVLLAVIRHPERYDAVRGSVEAWLAIQLKSRCLDRLRKRSKIVLREDAEPEREAGRRGLPLPEETVVARMEREALRGAMQTLSNPQRETLAAAYFSSRTQRELAEDWQVPLGTVKSRVRYGLHHLRRAMAQLGWGEPEGDGGHAE